VSHSSLTYSSFIPLLTRPSIRQPTVTYQPTTTWYPTATWRPTITSYPTRHPRTPEASRPDTSSSHSLPTFEPTVERDAGYDKQPDPKPFSNTRSSDGFGYSNSNTSHDTSSDATNQRHLGGFQFGIVVLMAVLAAMGVLQRHRTRQFQSQRRRMEGLELFDIGHRRMGQGYQDVPDAACVDIRGFH
jgi:hypothetical protein